MRIVGRSLLVVSFVLNSIGFGQSVSKYSNLSHQQEFYKNQTQVINFKDARGGDVQILTSHVSIPKNNLPDLFNSIPKDSKSAILVSYPESTLGKFIQDNQETVSRGKKNYLLPLGIDQLVTKTKYHLAKSISDDRVGLFFVTVNTAYDSFLWIHADSFSVEQRTTMILFNIIVAGAFGLDKDLWARMTQPLENRIGKFLESISLKNEKIKLVASSFMANMAFSIGIQTARMAILNFPTLVSSFSSLQFWGTSLMMGSLLTLSSFGWSEQLADVDQTKNPIAKALLRRFMEVRTVTMGQLAPSSKLLQTDVYGLTPIVSVLVHGSVGIWMMLSSNKIVDWIESRQTFQYLFKKHQLADFWLLLRFEEFREALSASCQGYFR